jgi:hypothetical protein
MSRVPMLMLALALAACSIGTRVEREPVAVGPAGTRIEVELETREIAGELLEVQDTAVLLLSDANRIILVPLDAIRTMNVVGVIQHFIRRGRIPTPAQRDRLRLFARYPQGLTSELRDRLLRAYDQAEYELAR